MPLKKLKKAGMHIVTLPFSTGANRISALGFAILALPFLVVYNFSTHPILKMHEENESMLILDFKHSTAKRHECDEAELEKFKEEISGRQAHMKKNAAKQCSSRDRLPMYVTMSLDGKTIVDETIHPAGLRDDGPAFIHHRKVVPSGTHSIRILMKDGRMHDGKDYYHFEDTVNIPEKKNILVDFNFTDKKFTIEGI